MVETNTARHTGYDRYDRSGDRPFPPGVWPDFGRRGEWPGVYFDPRVVLKLPFRIACVAERPNDVGGVFWIVGLFENHRL